MGTNTLFLSAAFKQFERFGQTYEEELRTEKHVIQRVGVNKNKNKEVINVIVKY